MRKPITPEICGALLAARFAQESGLPIGNYWEPAIARKIANDLRTTDRNEVERVWRIRLGLKQRSPSNGTRQTPEQ